MILIAELATAHGGDVGLAEAMIHAAAEAGATHVKTQAYSLERLNPADPQADWLRRSWLNPEAHSRLLAAASSAGVQYLSTPFDADSLQMLRGLGLKTFKVASSECGARWVDWGETGERWIISFPWGVRQSVACDYALTAIPLYPTPLEAIGRATLLDGWSDHCEGIAACLWAIAQGVKVLEVHITYPSARVMPFDKHTSDITRLRDFAEDCETMQSGVARKFRERWSA